MTAAEGFIARKSERGDRAALKEIIELSFDKGIYSFFANRSLGSAENIIVIELEGRVIGFAEPRQVRIKGKKLGNILWLATHPDFRRIGIGSRLVDECVQFLKERATASIYVSIEGDNLPSLQMFEKKGFARAKFSELTKQYGFRVLSLYSKFMIAPHEKVMVKNMDGVREPSSI
jgi:[ribosomal protein S18]-alanine N-acetyltransferase